MTDTDLVAAGSGAQEPDLPTTATSEPSDTSPPAAVDVQPRGQADGSLTTMVLPELRALANEVGVKGTSGMRKNELIAAIRERRDGRGGEGGDNARNGGAPAASDTATETSAPETSAPKTSTSNDAPEAPAPEQTDTAPSGSEGRADKAKDKPADAPTEDVGKDEGKGEGRKNDTRRDDDQGQGGDDQRRGQNRNNNNNSNNNNNDDDDDGDNRQGRRGRRFRDRRRRGDRPGGEKPAAVAVVTPNSARTTWSSLSRAFSTCSTTTRSCARPVIWPDPTTSMSR